MMLEQEKSEAYEHKGKRYLFRSSSKVDVPQPFEVRSIATYEAYEKEISKRAWLTFIPVLVFIGGLILTAVSNNYFDFSFTLYATGFAYVLGVVVPILDSRKTGVDHELERLKDYAADLDRKEAYDAWLGTKTDKEDQDEKMKAWIKSNNAKSSK